MNRHKFLSLLVMTLVFAVGAANRYAVKANSVTANGDPPRVNVPYTSATFPNIPVPERAIFWFGEVGPTDANYTDVRVIYNDEMVMVTLHIFDRLLYYDGNPSIPTLTDWDAATLLLDLDGAAGSAPDANAYQFVAQLNHFQPRDDYQTAYQGNGSGWVASSAAFSVSDGWQGDGINDTQPDRGWNLTFEIPYASLGMASPPAQGTIWGLALIVHDRDTASGTPQIPNKVWPNAQNPNQPATWGELHFGLPSYTPPVSTYGGTVTVRHGLNGSLVPDAQVGGNANCGWPPLSGPAMFWPQWGSLNYANYPPPQDYMLYMNIQNQWNLGDWPCFSKYYVTFPLDNLPQNGVIRSATLELTQFGNSEPSQAQPSLIQFLTVADAWDEATITWNNAPQAVANVGRGWVDPIGPPWNQVKRSFDLSLAVAQAHSSGQPLQLAVYSADNLLHSGKYFRSSDVDVAEARPTLFVEWGWSTPPTDWLYLPSVSTP